MTEETEPLKPLYDPKAARWFLGRLSAPTLRQLSLKLPEGTVIPDYYPDGYAATRDGIPIGRAELRTTYNKRKFTAPRGEDEWKSQNPGSSAQIVAAVQAKTTSQPALAAARTTRNQDPTARGIPRIQRSTPSPLLYKKFWGDDEMIKLRAMAQNGSSAQDIANATGRSRNAVIGQCHRVGIRIMKQPITPRGPGKRRGAYGR